MALKVVDTFRKKSVNLLAQGKSGDDVSSLYCIYYQKNAA